MISPQQLLTPDTFPILQCDPQSLSDRNWTPEQDLQAKILYQSWNDLWTASYPHSRRAKRLVRESIEWVEDNNFDYIFGSVSICLSLGFDIGAVRTVFRAVVAQRDTAPTEPDSTYVILANKLLEHIRQPEILTYGSKDEARRKRTTLSINIPRILDNPQKYAFHARVMGLKVACWVEEIKPIQHECFIFSQENTSQEEWISL